MMAAEAARRSSLLVITSDNPRSEDPAAIAADMLAGLDDDARLAAEVVLDRAGAKSRSFDDREQVRAALALRAQQQDSK